MRNAWMLVPALWISILATPASAQVGACCLLPCYECVVIAGAECDSLGGVYFGDGTGCEPLPCPLLSACCLPDGSCTFVSEPACEQSGGSWHEPCVTCDQEPCPVTPVEPRSWGRIKVVYR